MHNGPPTQLRVRAYYCHFEEIGGDFSLTYTVKEKIISRMAVVGWSNQQLEMIWLNIYVEEQCGHSCGNV